MVRKQSAKTKKVEVENPKTPATPATPESIGDINDIATSPTFTSIEQENTTIWSSSFSWNIQSTSELDADSANNIWEEDHKDSDKLYITKNNEVLDNKDDFEENVWTDVQMVAGVPNNQSFFSVPFTVPDSSTILESQVESDLTTSKAVEPISYNKKEVENNRKDSNEASNSEKSDYVDLGEDNFPSKELSKEFGEFTNPDVKLDIEIILDNQELNDSFNQCENVKSEKFVVNEKEDDDFGVFECSEESSFDEFGEFKSEDTNDFYNYQGNEQSISDYFSDIENGGINENVTVITEESNNSEIQNESPLDLDHIMSIKNSVAGWIAVLDKIYNLRVLNSHNNKVRPLSIEDLVYNSHEMMNADLNWSSFIELWSDQGGVIGFTWRGSQIQKSFLESVNSISMIKTANRLPGSDLFNDKQTLSSSMYQTTHDDNYRKTEFSSAQSTHDYKIEREEKNSTEMPFNNTDNIQGQDAPIESTEDNDIDQGVNLNRDSWITMSDLSFLESLSSRQSSISSTNKSQRKSETLLDDFLDIGETSTTIPNNNSRMDSFITQINHVSTDLISNLGTLKSNPIKENPSSSIAVNLLDDSIIDLKKVDGNVNELLNPINSNNFHPPAKKKSTSSLSSEFGDMVSAFPSDNLNQGNFLSFDDQVFPKSPSSNKNTASSTKLYDHPEYDTSSSKSLSSEMVSTNDADLSKPSEQKQQEENVNWISSTDLSFLESFTKNSKPSNSRKFQQDTFFDFSEFTSDLKLPSNVQPQNSSDTFLQMMSHQVDKGNTFSIINKISKVKQEQTSQNSNSKQLYTPSMKVGSKSDSSEFGEMRL
ncbi:16356_t:CDS:2 [Funneliformis geosporum]|nr:16356_t:CDS:2 [Funneliformis geosporum]